MNTKRLLLRGLLVLGILLLCSPVIGLLGMAFIVKHVSPGLSAFGDDTLMIPAGIGLLLAPVGIGLIIASLIALRSSNRSRPVPLPPSLPSAQG